MKKFELKLNADAPGQHTAILVLSFVVIWMSVLEAIKSPSEELPLPTGPKGPYALTGETLYENPGMTWYEAFFCRGFQRTPLCSYRLLHPFAEVFRANGIRIEESPPEKHVINYRGPLPERRSLSSHIVLENERHGGMMVADQQRQRALIASFYAQQTE